MTDARPTTLPALHSAFLDQALPRLAADSRLVGVAAAGSFIDDSMDAFSDLDLIVAVEPDQEAAVREDRQQIAATLGPLLAAFTGEHVGEPRVLICLYGPPALHVDLKFVALDDAVERVEEPVVLWEREGRLSAVLAQGEGRYPSPDPQWIEDRFWVWVHYAATKLGRGELFETLEFLSFLRMFVLGPLGLEARGLRPTGVRRIEAQAPDLAEALDTTVATREPGSLLRGIRAAVALYQQLREQAGVPDLQRHEGAEALALEYLDTVGQQLGID